jgi:uracil-DNA glycosylase
VNNKQSDQTPIIKDLRNHLKYLKEDNVDLIPKLSEVTEASIANENNDQSEFTSPSVATASSEDALYRLRLRIGDCTRCALHASRTSIVFGEGNTSPEIVMVGEGPGVNEDKQGKPFVGSAGKLLNRIIQAMGLEREEVYICNVVKCRPPKNRDPDADETATCGRFLTEQIQILNPTIILALGRISGRFLTNSSPQTSLGSLRNQIFTFQGYDLAVTYHPSALLRNPGFRRPLWDDVQMVMKHIGRPVPDRNS